jgi:cysteine desulfuration protein SufE
MGHSDAAFTNGLVAIIVNIFSGATAQEIRDTDTNEMIKGLQLPTILTPSRRNGAFNMFKKIKYYAN